MKREDYIKLIEEHPEIAISLSEEAVRTLTGYSDAVIGKNLAKQKYDLANTALEGERSKLVKIVSGEVNPALQVKGLSALNLDEPNLCNFSSAVISYLFRHRTR